MLNEFVNIANELDKRGLRKEADELDALLKLAFPWIPVGIGVGVGVAAGLYLKLTENGMTIMHEIGVTNIRSIKAGEAYDKWRRYLLGQDLIDGHGSFPAGNYNGEDWVVQFLDYNYGRGQTITVDQFESSIDKFYAGSTVSLVSWGLDNEDGWVDSFNVIVTLKNEQDTSQGGTAYNEEVSGTDEFWLREDESPGGQSPGVAHDPVETQPSTDQDAEESSEESGFWQGVESTRKWWYDE